MRRILVTGANKGIGLAIAKAILDEHDDTFVYLGARDLGRGTAAAATLNKASRIEVVTLDVADDGSVAAAVEHVTKHAGAEKLYGVVNNAGLGSSMPSPKAILEVNARGVQRVCEAFLPRIGPKGRIVNVTSAAGPSFVATCSPAMQRFFLGNDVTLSGVRPFIDECIAMAGNASAYAAKGLSDGAPYGLSKACANLYTLLLARQHPELRINACTPGFIATDLTRHYVESQGKTAAELGMKPPSEGTRAPMFLLFGEPEGNGRYYGSDAKRSPLDRYRSPGTPAYEGD
jgi:NAD(P)-dependent dehydrogenase (short-subunit alcohol dehydrogenase family)